MKHVLQDSTTIEVLPTEDAILTQGDQVIVMSKEKWLEMLLFITQPEFRKPKVPPVDVAGLQKVRGE
jgi:hypothetical protein